MTTSLPLNKLDPTRVDHPNMFARFKHSSLLIRSQKIYMTDLLSHGS